MITLRTVLSPFIEAKASSILRQKLAESRANKDSRGTELSAQSRGFPVLEETDFLPPQNPDKTRELFILGSGPSVLELTPVQFSRMRKGTTIGVNSWVLHDFVPDAYSLEEMESDDYVSVANGLSQALAGEQIEKAKPYILHLRPKLKTPERRLVSIPPALKPRCRYYGRMTVETRKVGNLTLDLQNLLRAQMQRTVPPHILIDGGYSIARMASLGILKGYSSIVFVGVDLNANRYFFEEDPTHLARHGLADFNPWKTRSSSHDTEETTNRAFAASQFLAALAKASETLGGPKFFVMSPQSRLAKTMPVWPF